MDLILFRNSLEHVCLQARAEYRLYQGEEGLNIALAKLKGILAGCAATARALEGEAGSGEMLEIAREVTARHQRELAREE
jgi:hypothetical protein